MKELVVDRPSLLTTKPFQKELLLAMGFSVLVLESEWRTMPATMQLILRPHLMNRKIRFVPLDQLSYEEVFIYLSVHKMSPEGMTLLAYCRRAEIPFYSEDPALRRVARELNVILFNDMSAQKEMKAVEKISMKHNQ